MQDFCVVTVDDEHTKPRLKRMIKGYFLKKYGICDRLCLTQRKIP